MTDSAALRRATGAPILIHPADAESLRTGRSDLGQPHNGGRFVAPFVPFVERFIGPEPCEPDELVTEGTSLERYGLPATVLYTPGHTPGSTTLLVEGGHAFVGDLITSENPIPRLQRNYATNWDALRPSLEKLRAASPRLLYPGHGNHIPAAGNTLSQV